LAITLAYITGFLVEYMDKSYHHLLLLISQNNEDAFKCLFKQERNKLFQYIFKITKSREASEEIVMDVFMKLWMSRQILTEIQHFPSFFFHIARNKALDFLRRAAKDHVLQELIWDEIQAVSDNRTDEKLLCDELHQELNVAINKLSPQRQIVFKLSREQHMTHDQIAAHLNLSKSTVKNHMIDALRSVKQHLGHNLDLVLLGIILFKK
jgi:RNA polymerase sigma-70 factor (family 1)